MFTGATLYSLNASFYGPGVILVICKDELPILKPISCKFMKFHHGSQYIYGLIQLEINK